MRTPAAIVVFLLALGAPAGQAGAQTPGIFEIDRAGSDRADDLAKRANVLTMKDRWAEAEPLYREAWKLKRSYDIAGNLGVTEAMLGKNRDAAEHLSFALKSFPANGKVEHRKLLEVSLAKARAEVAALAIKVSIARADVLVDGKSVGVSPLEGPIFVEPGTHTVTATLEEHRPAEARVSAGKGEAKDVALTLVRAAETLPVKVPGGGMKPAIVISGSALTAVALGTGIGLFAVANGKKSGTDATRAGLVEQGGCSASSMSAGCKDLHDTLASASTMHNVAVGVLVGAGVAGVATAAYAVISSRPRTVERAATRVRIAPMFGSSGDGLLIRGTF